jgi:putative endonuclease
MQSKKKFDIKYIKSSNYEKGLEAENKALNFLENKGYKLLAKRYKTKFGEIDLILLNKNRFFSIKRGENRIIFCEIKFRKNVVDFENIINRKQMRRVADAANIFLLRHKEYDKYYIQFDIVIFANNDLIYIENFFPN